MISVGGSLVFSEGIADMLMHEGKQSCLPCIPEILIVEMRLAFPSAGITETAFRDKTVNVRIPFKIPAEGMKDADETGSEMFRFAVFEEHPGHYRINGRKKVIKKRTVFKEPVTESVINGKNTVSVFHRDNLKRHSGSSVDGVHVAAGGAESRMASKGNKLEVATVSASIHGTAERRVTTINHLINVLDDGSTRM